MNDHKPKILMLVSHYLPGYLAGGPIVSVSNLVTELSAEFDFMVLTRDRDLHDKTPYPQHNVGKWYETPFGTIFYLSPKELRFDRLCRLISSTPHDVLFLNSFFDARLSVQALLARRLGLIPKQKLLIAPRGEFAPSALEIKSWKKASYLWAARAGHFFRDAVWWASSTLEAEDICRALGEGPLNIKVAPDLPRRSPDIAAVALSRSTPHVPLKMVFLSRISPMKNLDFALRVLAKVHAEVVFEILGPIEDEKYWASCQGLIATLRSNIKVHYRGAVPPSEILDTMARYDLFFLPTRGENFGHVIIESLSAGTPVLISERTSWIAATDYSCTVLPLTSGEAAFANYIDLFSSLPSTVRRAARDGARRYAESHLNRNSAVAASRRALQSAVAGR